ncbi:MAG: DNA polymerase III subunit epsilon [Proteobacteria bacterium]|nr:MAG: DNA polymerase III subunit epsilon [Pseudomonadota bacterium]
MNPRQVVLDTETTGLEPERGHRIIEIGCVELIDRRYTRNNFHYYLNPEREIDAAAIEVHGIKNEQLVDEPKFAEISGQLAEYLQGAELIIHNAAFDVAFLDAEFARLEDGIRVNDLCEVVDSLHLARKLHPGQKNNLDALCRRYGIDNSQRTLHGALLDAEILADVYLAMTGGQTALNLAFDTEASRDQGAEPGAARRREPHKLVRVAVGADDLEAHAKWLGILGERSLFR